MLDYLDKLALDAKETIIEGYYEGSTWISSSHFSLKEAIKKSVRNAVITEVKAASPSRGIIKSDINPVEVAVAMENGGATGISVLTEPKNFSGSLSYLLKIREAVKLPILMKDIIINPIQLEAASRIGANVVLLIKAIFDRGYCEFNLDSMINKAHSKGLEVLLETHSEYEFFHAVETSADLIGINNRDLRTLIVDFRTTEKILNKYEKKGKVIISESGIETPADLLFIKRCGAQAFLIGSSIMMADNIEKKVKEFVAAH
jgi:indole-3-glycerol phosphate synthase